MMEIAARPIHIFLDFNAVIVNLDSLPPETQKSCVADIEKKCETVKNLSGTEYPGKRKYP